MACIVALPLLILIIAFSFIVALIYSLTSPKIGTERAINFIIVSVIMTFVFTIGIISFILFFGCPFSMFDFKVFPLNLFLLSFSGMYIGVAIKGISKKLARR